MRHLRHHRVMLVATATISACTTLNREFDYGRQMAIDGIEWFTTPGYAAAHRDLRTK